LQVIRAGVGIAIVIVCDAAWAIGGIQIDPETIVREDGIAKHCIVDGCIARNRYSTMIWATTNSGAVERDDITGA